MALLMKTTVEEEMKKNPELRKSDLDMLREWLKKQPHLPPMSDYELILFSHSNYFRTEPTKTTIDALATFRTHVPEFFSGRDQLGSKKLRDRMKVGCFIPLASTTPEGYRVVFTRLMDTEPSRFSFIDCIKLILMVMELWLYGEGTSPGYIILIDTTGGKLGHLACLSPTIMKKLVYFVQEGIPIRLKGIHFMNPVPFMDTILNIAKPFMKKELMDLIVIHSSSDSLSKSIPIEILPNEVGGKAGPLEDLWAAEIKVLEDHRDWFMARETLTVNEAARPGKAKNATDLFGVEGSFKKLEID